MLLRLAMRNVFRARARSAITVGAGMMIIDTLFLDREASADADPAR